MKKTNKYLRLLVVCLSLFMLGQSQLIAQQLQLSGQVKDNTGEVLPGVTVVKKGTTSGIITDLYGNFTIKANQGEILEFSFVGMEKKEVTVSSSSFLQVTMLNASLGLEEVMVVAYGTQSKVSVTGAIASVGTETLLRSPSSSVTNTLAGAMTGVSSVQSIGQPGMDDAQIFIRGAGTLGDEGSAPLVLVDGVERSFSQLDPNEIENISVLKDASATAVFGVRGANGVILVTTRRGQEGKIRVSVSSSYSMQSPTRILETADSYTSALRYNEKLDNDQSNKQRFSDEVLRAFQTNSDPLVYPNTNWRKEIFNDFYSQTQHNVNFSGGSKKVRFFSSLGYLFQDGILKDFDGLDYDNNYSYNRFNYRTNLDIDVTATTKLALNVGGVFGKTHEPIEHGDGMWRQVNWAAPYSSPGVIDGKNVLVGSYFPVPVKSGLDSFWGNGERSEYKNKLNLDIAVNQDLGKILKGLSLGVKGAYNSEYTFQKNRSASAEKYSIYYQGYLDDATMSIEDPNYNKTVVYKIANEDTPLDYGEKFTADRDWYFESRLAYANTFNSVHKVSALLLYNQSKNYYPDAYSYLPNAYVGLVGRAGYNYKEKYFVDFNVGYNGSENFAPGKTRYGLFPATSVGWVMSEEKFMRNISSISFLKLRASYGIVGNDKLNKTKKRYLYNEGTYSVNGGGYNFGLNTSSNMSGASEGVLGNPGVTWETSTKQNYGVDLILFNNHLSFSGDVFHENRTGILITANSLPGTLAITPPALNLGEVINKGYELELGWRDMSKSFKYWVSGNMSFARNKIIYQDEVLPANDFSVETGKSTGKSFAYTFERFYTADDFEDVATGQLKEGVPTTSLGVPQPGDAKYLDLDGNGVVDADDQKYIGYAKRPEYVFGLNAGMEYKGFSFSMQWTGVTNVSRNLDLEYRIPFSPGGNRGLFQFHADERWTPETAETATLPRLSDASKAINIANSSLWIRDASYIRLKNARIAYRFDKAPVFKRIGMDDLTLYLTGYNLITFDYLDIVDPEAPTDGGKTNQYPVAKIYSIGLKFNF